MNKVAIFTEGQSELIFVRVLLKCIIDLNRLSFLCLKLHGDSSQKVPYSYIPPNAKVFFQIINVQNDGRVLTAIKEREEKLFAKGFEKVIGLRDMYCESYDKQSHGIINDEISKQIIEEAKSEIQKMSEPTKIVMCFSIMELESWFLSMYSIFAKIDSLLSVEYIERELGHNLQNVDPQTTFYRPSVIIKKIFQLCNMRYDKSGDDIEKIASFMDAADIEIAFENGRCSNFKNFYEKIQKYNE